MTAVRQASLFSESPRVETHGPVPVAQLPPTPESMPTRQWHVYHCPNCGHDEYFAEQASTPVRCSRCAFLEQVMVACPLTRIVPR